MRSRYILFVLAAIASLPAALPAGQVGDLQPDRSRPLRLKIGSNVQAAKIVKRVAPEYPDEARRQHIEGQLVLHAVIGTEGTVKELTVVSGPKELTQSALDAVKQWRYQQTLLNKMPIEVDTTITVSFPPAVSPERPAERDNHAAKPDSAPGPNDAANLRKQEQEALGAVDPETAADIRRLLEMTGAMKTLSTIFSSQMPAIRAQLLRNLPTTDDREKLADRFIQKMEDRVSSGEFSDVLIPIYAKYFTREDVKNSLAFFESPTGQRLTQRSPAYLQEVQNASSEHWTRIVIPELLREMAAEFPELGKTK